MRRLTPSQLLAGLDRREPFSPEIRAAAEAIVDDVRRRGDEALLEYTRRFDAPHLTRDELVLPPDAPARALEALPAPLREALERAAARIAAYHRRFVPGDVAWTDEAGNRLGRLVRPLDRVGIYVPGGRAAYPSTVLMTAIPARLVGVGEIVLATPPRPDGSIPAVVLAAAALAGVRRVVRAGGAQAVAALAYGTERVPAVDKIVGPGNAYVTAAKAAVAHRVGIDALAGPSEIVIVADDAADPRWVAADLLAQAEHDPLAVVGCLSPDGALLDAVAEELRRQLAATPRAAVAAAAVERGFLVATASLAEAVELANRLAPEHLSLQVRDPEAWLGRVRAAGAVFLGPFAPVAAGDYAAGTNHVLPTGGAARHQTALGPEAFVRCIPFFAGSPDGVAAWAPAARTLAEAEGLPAHAASIRLREAVGSGADPHPPAPSSAGRAPGDAAAPAPGYAVADGPAPVKLDANEAEPWPPALRQALVAELERVLGSSAPHRYPARDLRREVIARIAAYVGAAEEAVVLGNGSDELVQAVLGTLGARCTAAVAPSPTFGYYATAAAAAGVPYRPVPVPPERAVTLDDLQPVLDALPGEKLVFLCRPNNPTGLCCELEVVEGLLQRPDVWLVVDEAYAEFAGESVLDARRAPARTVCAARGAASPSGHRSPAAVPDAVCPGPGTGDDPSAGTPEDAGDAARPGAGGPVPAAGTAPQAGDLAAGDPADRSPHPPRLVVLRTLSKAFALAGARVGYAVAAPAVADRLRRWLQPYNVNTFSLVATRVALDHREAFLRRAEATRRRRDRLLQALSRFPGIHPLPSRGNFVLFRVERASDARPLAEALARRGIAVRAFPWEPSLTGYLRVTVGTEAENQAFLAALADALAAVRGGGDAAPFRAGQGPARPGPAAGSSGENRRDASGASRRGWGA